MLAMCFSPFDFQIVDLGVEGFADLARCAGEVDDHAVGIDVANLKPCD